MRVLAIVAVSLLAAFMATNAACSDTIWTPHGETEFVGHAIDKNSGTAVPGAWVFGIYILYTSKGHEQVHCTLAEVARANESGEYILPYHDGYPPTFIYSFSKRYITAQWPRSVSRDIKDPLMRWIVIEYRTIDGRSQIVGREGPFSTEEEAYKASRIRQDVWLEPFRGTEDEWLGKLLALPAETACPSKTTSGAVGWNWAILKEAESVPKSPEKNKVVRKLEISLELAKSSNPDGSRKFAAELRK